MLILQQLGYQHPGKDGLFHNLNLTINKQQKAALIGSNGAGKSTLLKLMAGLLQPSAGNVCADTKPSYVPQHFGQYNELSIAAALHIEHKLTALKKILGGDATEADLVLLDDDWNLEERCLEALSYWGLQNSDLSQKMGTLSGGQKTKVFLAGITLHKPELILMDEPGNHLDSQGRKQLYDLVQNSTKTLIVVSHDRKLLNLFNSVYELSMQGITLYGGNYDFYAEQKRIENYALKDDIRNKEKALRKAKEVERDTMERQHRLDARGKKKQEKAGLPTIAMKTLKNKAEKSTARTKDLHAEKTGALMNELNQLRDELPGMDKMKFAFDHSALHKGKVMITAQQMNVGYNRKLLWKEPLSFIIASGERISITGANGSGKTSLVKVLLGETEPLQGTVQKAPLRAVYIDQDYSLINNELTVYEQAGQFNTTALQEHEIKLRLNRFLFTKDHWNKSCRVLSGGEKMRLLLCCLTIMNKAPDLIVLDEPTNNLDIQNSEILTNAINEYEGTLLVISHDDYFLEQVHIDRAIHL